MSDDLKAVLKKTLKDREITIVTECFGIGCHEKGLEEIGTEMGLTRERVRQIREKAIEKIRESGESALSTAGTVWDSIRGFFRSVAKTLSAIFGG